MLISGENKAKGRMKWWPLSGKKEIIDKYKKGARISYLAAQYCTVKSTVPIILKNKEAIMRGDVVMGVKKKLKWSGGM